MTGPEHYRRAEELAAEAHRLPGQADGQATAGVWAAVAQTHAVLALAAATAVGASGADHRARADAAGTGSGSGRSDHRRIAAGHGRIVQVSVSLFENKPECCPFGHQLWPGKAQVSWTPCICRPAREAAGPAAAWDTSGSPATAATTSSGRRCSSSRRTTAGTGRSPAG